MSDASKYAVGDNASSFDQAYSHRIGEIIDRRYEVIAQLESGRRWEVYRVLDHLTRHVYQLRRISPRIAQNAWLVTRLERASKECLVLTHPHIVPIYAAARTSDGILYLIVDDLIGYSLKEKLKREGRLAPEQAIELLIQLAEALECAHGRGINHGHLTPANIWITKSHDQLESAKISNFQIDEIASTGTIANSITSLTSKSFYEQVLYISPEQCQSKDSDGRADIYALGCIMHETLSGSPPFRGKTPVKVILQHLNEPAPALYQCRKYSPALAALIARCLQKQPAARHASVSALLSELHTIGIF